MMVDPRCVVAIAEFVDGRYVQFWCEPDGVLISEVVSNLNAGSGVVLSSRGEVQLAEMGWRVPTGGPNPNWYFVARDVAGLVASVEMVRAAVLEVLVEEDRNIVSLRSWTFRRDPATSLVEFREQARRRYQTNINDIRDNLDGT